MMMHKPLILADIEATTTEALRRAAYTIEQATSTRKLAIQSRNHLATALKRNAELIHEAQKVWHQLQRDMAT